jgi:hypothetical protein
MTAMRPHQRAGVEDVELLVYCDESQVPSWRWRLVGPGDTQLDWLGYPAKWSAPWKAKVGRTFTRRGALRKGKRQLARLRAEIERSEQRFQREDYLERIS